MPLALCALGLPARVPFLERRLCRGELRDRNPVWAARNVAEAYAVAELDALRVASVLAADPNVNARFRAASQLHTLNHEFAHPFLVNGLEWVNLKDALVQICLYELAGVIPRKAERCLDKGILEVDPF